jgi:hypothetical protein
MRASPFDGEAPAPQAARAAGEPGEADGDNRARRDPADEDNARQEPLEEPGYGHGV